MSRDPFHPALRLHVGTCHLVGWGLETNTCVWRWLDNAIWLRCPDRQRSDGLEGSQCFSPFPAPPPLPEPIVEGQGRQNSVDLTIMATKPFKCRNRRPPREAKARKPFPSRRLFLWNLPSHQISPWRPNLRLPGKKLEIKNFEN